MAELKIKVGASVDRDLATAFRPVVEAARRAAGAADAEFKKSSRAIGTSTRQAVSASEKEYRKLEREAAKWAREQARAVEKARKDEVRATEKAKKDEARAYAAATKEIDKWSKEGAKAAQKAKQEEARAFEKAEREKTRLVKAEEQARLRAARDAHREMERKLAESKRNQQRIDAREMAGARRVGGSVVNALTRVGSFAASKAMGLAMGVARGAGMTTDLGTMFSQNAELEKQAVDLSNSGFVAGDKRNGTRVDPGQLMREALQIGTETGTDANEVIGGLQKFVGLTGDLASGRAVMADMLKLAKATGSSFEDMAAAAGNVAMALPESADKGEKVRMVMKAVAGMGKVGAVEIKDLASQMAKLSANAGSFEGKAEDNMITLAAMAQESRKMGGSASATQAATSVASFVSMLKTPKRAKEFEKATGTKVFDEKTGKLRDPQTIIKEALTAVGTDPLKLKNIFANVQGARAMEGFASVFREAGGGKQGLEAVDREFAQLKSAMMAEAEIRESFNRSMKTGQSQAEIFNNQMRLAALEMQTALMPAIMGLTPIIVEATKGLAGVITWLTGNKEMERISGKASTDVENVRKSIGTQLAGGNKISEATVEESRVATNEAFEAKARAAAELQTAKETRMGSGERFLSKAVDYTPLGIALAYMTGGSVGKGVGNARIEKEEQDIRAKELKAQEMDKLYQEASTTNKELLRKIDAGIVVKVSNLNELPNGPGGVGGAGRQPSPEDKAAQ